jgi:hypothetical protein
LQSIKLSMDARFKAGGRVGLQNCGIGEHRLAKASQAIGVAAVD